MPGPFDLLLFDLDETIFDFHRAEEFALGEAFRGLDTSVPEGYLEHYRRVNAEMWRKYERGEIDNEGLRVERFRRFLEDQGIAADPVAFGELVIAGLGRASFMFEGAKELLQDLRGPYRIAAITNGLPEVQRSRLSLAGIAELFEYVAISEEVGFMKPHPEIFATVFERLPGVRPERSLIIGDSLSSDIAGGRAFGLRTCWANFRGAATPAGAEGLPDFVIRELSELPGLLARLETA